MEKVVIFGAGEIGKKYFYNPNKKAEIVAVLDNNKSLIGSFFEKFFQLLILMSI